MTETASPQTDPAPDPERAGTHDDPRSAQNHEQADSKTEPSQAEKSEPAEAEPAQHRPPSYSFLALLASVVLLADALTKWWAETTLVERTLEAPSIVLIEGVLAFTLAYNEGGAFGMFAQENDAWRQPFFLIVSVGAVLFIVSMYRKLTPGQHTLRWGLPLVLGGALGNLADRLAKGKVVDFVDYQADWVRSMNELIAAIKSDWYVTNHWPTFNVADICICVGIGLMALDMFFGQSQEGRPAESADERHGAPAAR